MIYPQLFVGIDIGKFKHAVAIVNESKQVLGKVFEVAESQAGYQQLLSKLEQLAHQYQTREFRIGMEATGDYWKNLYHFLTRQSPTFLVSVINPVQTKRFAQSELRRAKTDAVNAMDIAGFMAEKKPRPAVPRSETFDSIKDLDRQVHAVHKHQTMTLNKLRIELSKVAPEIEHHVALARHQQVMVLLKHYPTAAAIAQASPAELRKLRYGKRRWQLSRPFITKVQALAQNSIAHKTGPGAGLVVQALVDQFVQQHQMVTTLQAHLTELYQGVKERPSLLATIPGIGPETAIALEAHIGDVAFRRGQKTGRLFWDESDRQPFGYRDEAVGFAAKERERDRSAQTVHGGLEHDQQPRGAILRLLPTFSRRRQTQAGRHRRHHAEVGGDHLHPAQKTTALSVAKNFSSLKIPLDF